MDTENKKVGIITFHASYNCGSMLQAYALQRFLEKNGYDPEMIDFSCKGQKELYSLYSKNVSPKHFIRNFIFAVHKRRIHANCERYERFKQIFFNLSPYSAETQSELKDDCFAVVAGADQIWNITIKDFDDAYFLPWVKKAKKIAYAPSFGAKNPLLYSTDIEKYKKFLLDFDSLSIRENNGQKWIKEMIGKEVPVVLDPTLLLSKSDYAEIESHELKLPEKYIFFYSPSYSAQMNSFVKKISEKYSLPVIAFNTKSFYLRAGNLNGFKLPDAEDPTTYLQLMKNAEAVITTSFHGSIFSTVYRKKFWVLKNGNMFGSDDRVITLLNSLGLSERLIEMNFDNRFDYMKDVDFSKYDKALPILRESSGKYLLSALGG